MSSGSAVCLRTMMMRGARGFASARRVKCTPPVISPGRLGSLIFILRFSSRVEAPLGRQLVANNFTLFSL